MADAVMTTPDREEALSRAYVSAVAAGAGYTTADFSMDRDGVDLQVRAGGSMRPSIDVQIKATVNLGPLAEGVFRFPLKRRNYDLLREQTMVPRILVVLDLPKAEAEWIDVNAERLVLRRCAYWMSLGRAPATENTESVTVSIPETNRFDMAGLKILMERARTGAIT